MFNGISFRHPIQSYKIKHRIKKNEKIRRDLDRVGLQEQADYNFTKMDPNQTTRSLTTQFLVYPSMIPGPNLLTLLPALYFIPKQDKHQRKHWEDMYRQQAKSDSGAPYGVRKTVYRNTYSALEAVAASLLAVQHHMQEVEKAKGDSLDDKYRPVFKVPIFIPKRGSGLCRHKPKMLEILTNDENWAKYCMGIAYRQLEAHNFFKDHT